jgi:hypothetical protein
LSQGSPNNPCSTKPLEIQPDLANDGSNRVYSQTRKPPTDRRPLRPAWPASSTCRRTSPGRTGPPRQRKSGRCRPAHRPPQPPENRHSRAGRSWRWRRAGCR